MNKDEFLAKLKEATGRSENECVLINAIIEESSLFGRKNKIKIINDFREKLNLELPDAEALYHTCMQTLAKGVFRKN